MLKLDPLRYWTDNLLSEIEDVKVRNIARAVYPAIHYFFILCLVWAGTSVINGFYNMVIEIAKLSATAN